MPDADHKAAEPSDADLFALMEDRIRALETRVDWLMKTLQDQNRRPA